MGSSILSKCHSTGWCFEVIIFDYSFDECWYGDRPKFHVALVDECELEGCLSCLHGNFDIP